MAVDSGFNIWEMVSFVLYFDLFQFEYIHY